MSSSSQDDLLAHQYELLRSLSRDEFAEVFEARDAVSGASVLVKREICEEPARSSAFQSPLVREFLMLSHLKHGALPEAVDLLALDSGERCLVTSNWDHHSRLKVWAQTQPDLDACLVWWDSLLSALEYLHAVGVIHGEMTTESAGVRIASGSGLAEACLTDLHRASWDVPGLLGSHAGAAGGRALGTSQAQHARDVYGAASILLWLLVSAHLGEPARPEPTRASLGRIRSFIPEALHNALHRMLLGDELSRPATVRDIRALMLAEGAWSFGQPALQIRAPDSRGVIPRRSVTRHLVGLLDGLRDRPGRLIVLVGAAGSGKTCLGRLCEVYTRARGFRYISGAIRMPGSEHAVLREFPDMPTRQGALPESLQDHTGPGSTAGSPADEEAVPPLEEATVCFIDDLDRLGRDDLAKLIEALCAAEFTGFPMSAVASCSVLPVALMEELGCALGAEGSLSLNTSGSGSPVDVHRLEVMEVDEVRILLGELLSRPISQDLADWITAKAGGSPLLASELVAAVVRSNGLTDGLGGVILKQDVADRLCVPASVASILEDQVRALGQDEAVVAKIASLGPGVNLGIIEAVTGLTSPQAQRAVNDLGSRGILKVGDEQSGLTFQHDLLRDVIYSSMSASERQRLHGAVSCALQTTPEERVTSPQYQATMAWHLYRSATPPKALEPAIAAASAYEDSGQAARALEYLTIAEELTVGADVRNESLRVISDLYSRLGRASDCSRVLARLLRNLEAEGAASIEEILKIECALGRSLTLGGDAQGALDVLHRASRRAVRLGDAKWVSRVSNGMAAVHQMRGEFSSIDAIADSNVALLEGSCDYESLSASCNVKGNAQSAFCNWHSAVDWYDKSAQYALLAEMPRLARAAICNKGLALMYLGAWDDSDRCFDRVVAMTCADADPYAVEMLGLNKGTLFQRRGALREAAGAFREAMEAAKQSGDAWGRALAMSNMGELECLCGNPAAALTLYDRSEDLMRQVGSRDDLPELLRRRAQALLATGRAESASEVSMRASELAGEMGNRLELANCIRVQAAISLNDGDGEEGVQRLEEAVSLMRGLNAPYELGLSLAELGFALSAQSNSRDAIRLLGEALGVFLGLGARRDARLVQEELARTAGGLPSQAEHLPSDHARLISLCGASCSLAAAESIERLLQESADIAAAAIPAETVAAVLAANQPAPKMAMSAMTTERNGSEEAVLAVVSAAMAGSKSRAASVMQPEGATPELRAAMSAAQARQVLLVPIASSDQVLGAIYLDYRERDGDFSEQDIRFLEALAAQAAIALENALLRSALQDEVEYLRWEIDGRSSFSNIIGQSLEMQKLFTMLQKVSRTSVTVLIEGESGTGKELVARAIHHNGPRKTGRFLAQNCAALPEQLLESELFGHVRGAFTGAMREKPGLFEAADGGTFFLDEIADMPPSLQVKLLRVLQDGEIRRVGATDSQSVDVRIIAATNKTLEDEVKAGRFREDLFYRLNVVKIEMPPLRDRRDDIPLLAQHFLDAFSKDMEGPPQGFSDEAMECLVNYDWPGNVRELENEVQRALALADPGTGIRPNVLSERIRSVRIVVRPPKPGTTLSLKDMVTDVEKRVILQVLEENDWNKSRTAELLGLSRQGLLKKIARFGLKPEGDDG